MTPSVIPSGARDLGVGEAEIARLRLGMTPSVIPSGARDLGVGKAEIPRLWLGMTTMETARNGTACHPEHREKLNWCGAL
jgi:hypothetical protein